MGFYNDVIFPGLCELAMRKRTFCPTASGQSVRHRAGCSRSASGLAAISPSTGRA